jgi:hypothetical protein
MANQYVNKVVINGVTKIDLTSDTVTADKILSGYKAHIASGAQVTGSCDLDSNTTSATATAGEILATKTAYVNKNKITGTMTNNGGVTGTITTKAGEYTIPSGYHDGSGKVSISSTEQAKIIGNNIRKDVVILGVTGTLDPSSEVTAQAKVATPTFASQTILPDEDVDYLSQVTVNPIPVTEVDNVQGGVTLTVG